MMLSPKKYLKLIGVAVFFVVQYGCSSAPEFKPSTLAEEASSFEEGTKICATYQIQGQTDSNGQPLQADPVVILPWIRCAETLLHRFSKEAQSDESFVMLFRALESKYTRLRSRSETVRWTRLNLAVRLAWQAVQDRKTFLVSDNERFALETELPSFAMHLAESGYFFSKPVTTVSAATLEDEISTKDGRTKDLWRDLPRGDTTVYCARSQELQKKRAQAKGLKSYLDRVESSQHSEESLVLQTKLREKWTALELEVARDQAALSETTAETIKKNPGFRPERCIKR